MPIPDNANIKDFVSVLKHRKWYVILSALLCFLAGAAYYVVVPKKFISTTTILVVPQRIPEAYVRSTVSIRIEDRLATIRQQILSRTRLQTVMDELGLFGDERKRKSAEDMVEKMRRRIELQVRGNDAFVLSFIHEDQHLAMLTTSRLASYFIDENLKIREQQAVGTSEFLESQLEEAKRKLEFQENRVKHYKMQYMGELPQQIEANLAALSRFQDRFRTVSDAIRAAEDRKVFYEAQLNSIRQSAQAVVSEDRPSEVVVAVDPALSAANELSAKRARLQELSSKYTERYPEIQRLRREIEQLEVQIVEIRKSSPPADNAARRVTPLVSAQTLNPAVVQEIQRLTSHVRSGELELITLKKEREEIKKGLEAIQAKVERTPKREQELFSITRDYDNLKRSYDELLRKKLDADISQNLEKRQKGEQFQILDPPNLPEEPFSPAKRVVLGVSLFAACLLGLGGAIAFEFFDKTIKGTSEFRKFVDLPLLVALPVLRDKGRIRMDKLKDFAFAGASVVIVVMIFVLLVFGKDIVSFISSSLKLAWRFQ